MNHTTLTVTVFSFLVGTLVFAIWSNTHVFGQQIPSVSSSPSSPAAGNRSSSSSSNPISPGLKAKMCDPSNPGLKVVNTTESRIYGIPKTVKPLLLSSAAPTPPTSAESSSISPSQQQTTTTKPTAANITAPKQQQVKTSNNTTNAISRPTGSPTGTTIASVSHPIANASSSSSSSSSIAPQIKAVNQQLPRTPSPTTTPINGTAGQNDAFAATPPMVASGKLMYLGYHGGDSTLTNGDSSPNDKSSSDSKPSSTPHITSTPTDNDSKEKTKESSSSDSSDSTETTTKSDIGPTTNGYSSSKKGKSISHTDHLSESSSSSSDLGSAIRNKVDSIIKNTFSRIKDNTPFIFPFP